MAAAFVMTADQRTEHTTKRVEDSRAKLQAEIEKDERRKQWPYIRKALYELIHTKRFEMTCGAIILVNMGVVVIETDAGVDDGQTPAWAAGMTLGLLFFYTAELLVKLYVFRLDFFFDMWNVIDFMVVGVDLILLCISAFVPMPSVSILRVFRLVKLARAFKAAKSFPELRSLLRSCACAFKAIFWGMLLLLLSLTVWGILAVQLIHPINKAVADNKPWLYEGCERCPRAYATVFGSMLTFWKQLVAGDSWGTLCEPIIEEAYWTSLFFMLVLVTVNLTMLNCILAVVVEAGANAAAADEHDKAMERERTVVEAEGKLIDLCHGLDCDASGSLTIEEFYQGFQSNKEFKQCLDVMHVSHSDMEMIFNICDEDDSGDVDYREFVDQLRRIKHSSEQMILNYVTDIRHIVNKIKPEIFKPSKRLEARMSNQNATEKTIEEKKREFAGAAAPGKSEKQLASAAESMQESPPESSAILPSTSEQPPAQPVELVENKDTDQDQAASVTSPASAILPQAGWERFWQFNQDLVTIMREHSEQTKVTHQLLNTVVRGLPSSTPTAANTANGLGFSSTQDKQPGVAEPDTVHL